MPARCHSPTVHIFAGLLTVGTMMLGGPDVIRSSTPCMYSKRWTLNTEVFRICASFTDAVAITHFLDCRLCQLCRVCLMEHIRTDHVKRCQVYSLSCYSANGVCDPGGHSHRMGNKPRSTSPVRSSTYVRTRVVIPNSNVNTSFLKDQVQKHEVV